MKKLSGKTYPFLNTAVFFMLSLILVSCTVLDPRKVDVAIVPEPPAPKITNFDKALSDLGLMTLIYGCDILNIMADDGEDHTGTSVATSGEIPRDILEMIKSTLNSIGGNVYFIPYNPDFINSMVSIGWTTYNGKRVPHAVLTGGITEFDRALETRGENTDFDTETQPFTHAPKWTPGDMLALEYGQGMQESLARITLDFNLLDFQANVGIPKMQTVNSIHVHKATAEKELAVTIFGPTFGLKGTIKKVEGRHAAVRILVQLSIIQLVGKYFDLPYWKLLQGSKPDPVVLDTLTEDLSGMETLEKIIKIKELLFLNGYNIAVNGTIDEEIHAALKDFDKTYIPSENGIDKDIYLKLYSSIPVTSESLQRRYAFNKLLEQFIISMRPPPPPVEIPETPAIPENEKSPRNPAEPQSDNHTSSDLLSPDGSKEKNESETDSDISERKKTSESRISKIRKKKKKQTQHSGKRAVKQDKEGLFELLELLGNKVGKGPEDTVDSNINREW